MKKFKSRKKRKRLTVEKYENLKHSFEGTKKNSDFFSTHRGLMIKKIVEKRQKQLDIGYLRFIKH